MRAVPAASGAAACGPGGLTAWERGAGKGREGAEGVDVDYAPTLEWVAWYNHQRLLEPLGYVPPAEFEQAYHDRQAAPGGVGVLTAAWDEGMAGVRCGMETGEVQRGHEREGPLV